MRSGWLWLKSVGLTRWIHVGDNVKMRRSSTDCLWRQSWEKWTDCTVQKLKFKIWNKTFNWNSCKLRRKARCRPISVRSTHYWNLCSWLLYFNKRVCIKTEIHWRETLWMCSSLRNIGLVDLRANRIFRSFRVCLKRKGRSTRLLRGRLHC